MSVMGKAATTAISGIALFTMLIGAVAAAAVTAVENLTLAPVHIAEKGISEIEHGLATLGHDLTIPFDMLSAYTNAAPTCPGMNWTLLAGIGQAETSNDKLPTSAQISTAGAVGPMQFLPSTFAEYAYPVPPGGQNPPTPWDPIDAAYAAARYLCASGARNGANIPAAIYAYNHSDTYVAQVLDYTQIYTDVTTTTGPAANAGPGGRAAVPATGPPSPAAQAAIAYAQAQLGLPYQWGGDGPTPTDPTAGFDCSGLVQAAYAAAGIPLPRTAGDQYAATWHLPPGTPLQPGDLVFYGTGTAPDQIEHVGLYLGAGTMIDAPHPTTPIRSEPYHYPNDHYIGATRPTHQPPPPAV